MVKMMLRGHFIGPNLTFPINGESYLISRVHRDGQGASKTHYRIWYSEPHPLRWSLLASSFFFSYWLQECDRHRFSSESAEQPLQRWRVGARDPLSHDSRSGTDRDYLSFAAQRCLSISERIADLPQSKHSQTVLAPHI